MKSGKLGIDFVGQSAADGARNRTPNVHKGLRTLFSGTRRSGAGENGFGDLRKSMCWRMFWSAVVGGRIGSDLEKRVWVLRRTR